MGLATRPPAPASKSPNPPAPPTPPSTQSSAGVNDRVPRGGAAYVRPRLRAGRRLAVAAAAAGGGGAHVSARAACGRAAARPSRGSPGAWGCGPGPAVSGWWTDAPVAGLPRRGRAGGSASRSVTRPCVSGRLGGEGVWAARGERTAAGRPARLPRCAASQRTSVGATARAAGPGGASRAVAFFCAVPPPNQRGVSAAGRWGSTCQGPERGDTPPTRARRAPRLAGRPPDGAASGGARPAHPHPVRQPSSVASSAAAAAPTQGRSPRKGRVGVETGSLPPAVYARQGGVSAAEPRPVSHRASSTGSVTFRLGRAHGRSPSGRDRLSPP